jgi:hypothetical protein
MHGERSGFNNTPWSMQFLELIEDPTATEAAPRTADTVASKALK